MADRFKSKGGFILASVGAAVGLGNALRFPGLCAKYGGGTFLFIYMVALLVLGVPLLNAEIALGRKVKGGAPRCMKSLIKGGEHLGWAQCTNSLITAIIYAGLAGWILSQAITIVPYCMSGGGGLKNYFFEGVLNARGDGVISGISPLVCLAIAVVWVMFFVCLKGGAKSLAGAAKFTVFIPVALILIIAVRGLFYNNASEALSALFLPDLSNISSPELWINALGQVFFSLSLAVGIMPAYGGYLPERCNIFPASLVIVAADALVSVLASVALFTTVYGCGLQDSISQSGIITAFSVYPAAIAGLFESRVVCAALGVLFYVSLSLMAIQSGVSMMEAFFLPFTESFCLKRGKTAIIFCVICSLISLIFATTAADIIVEIADRFVNFYNVILLCIAECLAIGLSKGGKGLYSEIDRYSKKFKLPKKLYGLSVKFLCPAVLVALALPEFIKLFGGLNYPAWSQLAFGWGASLLVLFSGAVIKFAAKPRTKKRKVA